MKLHSVEIISLGRKPFSEVFQLQLELREQRQKNKIRDTVLLVEHPRVITRGRRPSDQDFLVAPEVLKTRGFDIEDAGRGGRLTYHGPGQLVAYFLVSLAVRRLSIPQFVDKVEAVVIKTLCEYGIHSERRESCPGVWVAAHRKIASIGLSIDRGVSMNGIALNVNPQLEDFEVIVPCGIQDCEMTSILRETGKAPAWEAVEKIFRSSLREVFGIV